MPASGVSAGVAAAARPLLPRGPLRASLLSCPRSCGASHPAGAHGWSRAGRPLPREPRLAVPVVSARRPAGGAGAQVCEPSKTALVL